MNVRDEQKRLKLKSKLNKVNVQRFRSSPRTFIWLKSNQVQLCQCQTQCREMSFFVVHGGTQYENLAQSSVISTIAKKDTARLEIHLALAGRRVGR